MLYSLNLIYFYISMQHQMSSGIKLRLMPIFARQCMGPQNARHDSCHSWAGRHGHHLRLCLSLRPQRQVLHPGRHPCCLGDLICFCRAGHLRYFNIFSIIKNYLFAFFIKFIAYFFTSPI